MIMLIILIFKVIIIGIACVVGLWIAFWALEKGIDALLDLPGKIFYDWPIAAWSKTKEWLLID